MFPAARGAAAAQAGRGRAAGALHVPVHSVLKTQIYSKAPPPETTLASRTHGPQKHKKNILDNMVDGHHFPLECEGTQKRILLPSAASLLASPAPRQASLES